MGVKIYSKTYYYLFLSIFRLVIFLKTNPINPWTSMKTQILRVPQKNWPG
jgi:hypothetical protein